jgi:hypothetical protein
MNTTAIRLAPLALLLLAAPGLAQPPAGITAEMIGRQLPLEGAPLAIPGPYEVVAEDAFGTPGYRIWRPADLSDFRRRNKLPVMAWGNGGCAIDATRYGDFLSTIASHGFVVISTVAVPAPVPAEGAGAGPGPGAAGAAGGGRGRGGRGQGATAANMDAAFDWADAENVREGSPLAGKIATDQMAAMGQSCGGFMSIEIGGDPRVGTIGVFNSGVNPPTGQPAPGARATTDALASLHGPVLFINGGEVDFMYGPSRDNFDRIENLPAFYGARENAGHTATVFHPGGGEYANVASNWLLYVFKDDKEAAKMFVGEDCGLCVLPTWETASKGLE